MHDIEIVVTIISSFLASSGLWAFIMHIAEKKSAQNEMLRGLGHDRIMELGQFYIDRGFITVDEYENLYDYLYKPYKGLKGNGTADKMLEDVKKLPLKQTRRDNI